MPIQRTSLDTIEDFLAQKRVAIVGMSRDPKSISALLFNELTRRGYDTVPVNPHAQEVRGHQCFARLQDIQPPVDAALLLTSPGVTDVVVQDCAECGIRCVWMHRAGGQGAVSDEAVDFCRERGISVIPGECPLMFLPQIGGVHAFHGFFRKLTGRYPRHAHV